jgi:hypothetical protein
LLHSGSFEHTTVTDENGDPVDHRVRKPTPAGGDMRVLEGHLHTADDVGEDDDAKDDWTTA